MLLVELRNLLNEYEHTWYFRKIFSGDHPEVIQIRHFLQEYEYVDDDYELTTDDIYYLLKIIPADSKLDLIKDIKVKINIQYAFYSEIFYHLSIAGYINEYSFITLANLSFIHRKHIVECLQFLNENKCFTPTAFNILSIKFHENNHCLSLGENHFLKILQNLKTIGCWSDKSLRYLEQLKFIDMVNDLIEVLINASIPINHELFKLICNHKHINYLLEISDTLAADNEACLTIQTFSFLLHQQFEFFYYKNPVLSLLQDVDLLDRETMNYVLNNNVLYFKNVLDVLSVYKFIDHNKDIIRFMIDKNFDHQQFYRCICYLNGLNLLDQNALDLLFDTADIKTEVITLLTLLSIANFKLSKANFLTFFVLSDTNIDRFHDIVFDLIENKLLNNDSFSQALQRITEKLQPVQESKIIKNSWKTTNLARSEMVLDNKFHLFTDHKKFDAGGFGKIKKAYHTIDAIEPVFGIKKLHNTNVVDAKDEAIREVKYHRMLGRESFYFFRKDRAYIVSNWQNEKALDEFTDGELTNVSIENRLRCLQTGLGELNIFHTHYRVHGDIKAENCIVDFGKLSMKFIDFGGSHKMGSLKSFAYTARYEDKKTANEFFKDSYAMGLVAMQLFPELFTVSFNQDDHSFVFNKTNLTSLEQGIVNLISAMMHLDNKLRCTSEDALVYCTDILNTNQLDKDRLEEIAHSSFDRTTTTLEDILHGTSKRAFTM